LARQLGIDDIVEFRAPVGDVFDAMADSDVLVMASEREGQPLVVAEALAAGLPVVATAVGRVPELVDPTVGRVVPPGDREALAGALTEVVCDRAVRSHMAAAAASRPAAWTLDAAIDAHRALYRSVCRV
jgi:glycosyltransferase involved in cell wall biosynthesis